MSLLKHGEIIEDTWVNIDGDEDLPQGASIIVGYDRLVRDFETLKTHNAPLGVRFPNSEDVEALLSDYLGALQLIVLDFPSFADGRAYSQGRRIRTQLEFGGELRASGNVLPDQIAMMRQCGFDAFDISERHSLESWHKAATAMTVSYQRSYTPERGFAPAVIEDTRHQSSA